MLLSATTSTQAARLKVEQTSASSVYIAMRGTLPSFGRYVAMISWMAKKPSRLTSVRHARAVSVRHLLVLSQMVVRQLAHCSQNLSAKRERSHVVLKNHVILKDFSSAKFIHVNKLCRQSL